MMPIGVISQPVLLRSGAHLFEQLTANEEEESCIELLP